MCECDLLFIIYIYILFLQCTPEQISGDLHDELMFQLDHDDNLQKVSLVSALLLKLSDISW